MKITEHERANGARLNRQSTGLPGGRALREINARQDVRKYAAEQGINGAEALEKGLKEKSAEFVEKGAEVYAKM
jgi:hypothetical protein